MEEENREYMEDNNSDEEEVEEKYFEENKSFHKPEPKHEMEHSQRIDNNPDKNKIKENIQKNPWIISTIILGIIALALIVIVLRGRVTGKVISENDAGNQIIEYLNSRTGGGVEYVSSEDLGNLYEITVEYQGQEIPVYMTKDGEYFVQGAVPLTGDVIEDSETQQPQEVPKSDKPVVELFVMTHCPYGTQAEKGIIPVYELLGDKIDSNIKFVHYFIHDPEETETPIQVCIRQEQSDKYLDYLKCFLEDGNSERCLTKTKIDKTKLNKCVDENADAYYEEDSALSEEYGVQGSPTLVINGQIISSGRSPANYLDTICSAFNTAPEECDEELSSQSPSQGFGYSVSGGSDTQAQC